MNSHDWRVVTDDGWPGSELELDPMDEPPDAAVAGEPAGEELPAPLWPLERCVALALDWWLV